MLFSLELMLSLQLLWQLMEYSYLLDQADKCDDPYMRMVYACKYFFLVMTECFITMKYCGKINDALMCYFLLFDAASWALSVYYAYQRTWKPFNPILGETYEMVNHDGITFISEQVTWPSIILFLHGPVRHHFHDFFIQYPDEFLKFIYCFTVLVALTMIKSD